MEGIETGHKKAIGLKAPCIDFWFRGEERFLDCFGFWLSAISTFFGPDSEQARSVIPEILDYQVINKNAMGA